MKTNWEQIALELSSLQENGSEIGSSNNGKNALELILGDLWIDDAVDCIINYNVGNEIALNCLQVLNSERASEKCYQIYTTSEGEKSRDAVRLIKNIGNKNSFKWIEEFLNDKNVMDLGLDLLDQILWSEEIKFDENSKFLLDIADKNSNGNLKDKILFIKHYIKERNQKQ